jgi:rhodanese-related sulfurtransferase
VKPIGAAELKTMIDRGAVTLFDVRPAAERAIAKIAQARTLEPADQAFLFAMDRSAPSAVAPG